MHKHRRDVSTLSEATGETGLTVRIREIVAPEKRIPRRKNIQIPSFVSTKKGSNSKSG